MMLIAVCVVSSHHLCHYYYSSYKNQVLFMFWFAELSRVKRRMAKDRHTRKRRKKEVEEVMEKE